MTELKNQLANKAKENLQNPDKKEDMVNLLTVMADEIKKALPDHVKSERFQRVALTAFNGNPKLQDCNPRSFLAAMMQSAQLGLEPNTPLGQAYLIPYGKTVQFQIGYKGLIDLANRTREYKTIYSHAVYENDVFEIEYGLNPKLYHKPDMNGDRGEVIGYYAVYKLINGGEGFAFMTKKEIEAHRYRFSKSPSIGPWKDDFDAMAKKTVLKQVLKYAPLSTENQEIQMASAIDEKAPNTSSLGNNNLLDIDWSYDVLNGEIDKETGEILEGKIVNE